MKGWSSCLLNLAADPLLVKEVEMMVEEMAVLALPH